MTGKLTVGPAGGQVRVATAVTVGAERHAELICDRSDVSHGVEGFFGGNEANSDFWLPRLPKTVPFAFHLVVFSTSRIATGLQQRGAR